MTKPTEITSEQLRRNVSDTFKRVAYSGEHFVITIHGKPVARIVPMESEDEKPRKPSRSS